MSQQRDVPEKKMKGRIYEKIATLEHIYVYMYNYKYTHTHTISKLNGRKKNTEKKEIFGTY